MKYSIKHIRILSAAEKLFAAKGFDGTTVREIADEAGVNLAMISYYFGSKEKLMQAVFEQRTSHIKMRVESLLKDNSLSSEQKINMLIDEHIERMFENQNFYKIMICEQVINKNTAIIKLLNEVKKRNAEIIGELIKDGQKKGEFKKKTDVVLLLTTLIGTVTQMMINKSYYKEFYNLNKISNDQLDISLKEKLSDHLKQIFKLTLINEG